VLVFPDDPSRWTLVSRYLRTAQTDENGVFTLGPLPPHPRYLAVALDYVETRGRTTGNWRLRARTQGLIHAGNRRRSIACSQSASRFQLVKPGMTIFIAGSLFVDELTLEFRSRSQAMFEPAE
jgi:hypothetical protein